MIKRYFMKPGPAPINDRVHHVEFTFPDEDDDGGIRRAAIGFKGETYSNCPWSFKDALSHLRSGTWAEVILDEISREWVAPSADELALIAKKRSADPNVPATTVEMVW